VDGELVAPIEIRRYSPRRAAGARSHRDQGITVPRFAHYAAKCQADDPQT
jgi:hypothetical protein